MNLIDLAHQISLQPKKAASTHGGEFSSACPLCGGRDRFRMQPNRQQKNCIGYYFCRQCGTRGDSIQFCIEFLGMDFKAAVTCVEGALPEKNFRSFSQGVAKKDIFNPTQINQESEIWSSQATTFVKESHKNIWNHPNICTWLNNRGISNEAITEYKIGYNPSNLWPNGADWGVEKQWLPRGIVIPTREPNGKISHLKIRRSDWKDGDDLPKYVAISGSRNGLSIIGSSKRSILIVVESELDAIAIHYAIGDLACVVAVGSNIKNPDIITHHIAQKAEHLLICYDNDAAGSVMRDKWQKLYSQAKALPSPMGKDIGEAIELGLSIRSWLLGHIIQEQGWATEDRELISWILTCASTRPNIHNEIKRHEQEIVLGPTSERAQSGVLQSELRLMKEFLEADDNSIS